MEADTCFLCLEEGDVVHTCAPNTCHNLKAHKECLRTHAQQTPICTICKVPYKIQGIPEGHGRISISHIVRFIALCVSLTISTCVFCTFVYLIYIGYNSDHMVFMGCMSFLVTLCNILVIAGSCTKKNGA